MNQRIEKQRFAPVCAILVFAAASGGIFFHFQKKNFGFSTALEMLPDWPE